ncbi:MAG: 16S rRNA (cytidine(1402)-2'-O)-methyltransferase [Candidatus Sericytochromatia bacterium]
MPTPETLATGTLYLCATPIGNLGDITLRCLETLKQVDLILAEDTRQTIKLLNHFEIRTPLRSFHAHNEQGRAAEVIERLQRGENLALVSDAGLPLISDPGAALVRQVQEAGCGLTVIPGASALTTGLQLSGIAPQPAVFLGFISRRSKERKALLMQWRERPETLVLFESPHRLSETLRDAQQVLGEREAAVCRELTKRFEEVKRAPLGDLIAHFGSTPPRGEITLVIAGASAEELVAAQPQAPDAETVQATYAELQAQGLGRKVIFEQLQQRFGLSRNALYALLH